MRSNTEKVLKINFWPLFLTIFFKSQQTTFTFTVSQCKRYFVVYNSSARQFSFHYWKWFRINVSTLFQWTWKKYCKQAICLTNNNEGVHVLFARQMCIFLFLMQNITFSAVVRYLIFSMNQPCNEWIYTFSFFSCEWKQ